MENIRRVLVISRMTPYCREAIHCGVSIARKYDAGLQVLHLVSNPGDMMAVNAPGLFPSEEYKNYQNIQREEKEELDKYRAGPDQSSGMTNAMAARSCNAMPNHVASIRC